MLRRAVLAGALIFSASCNKSEGGEPPGGVVAQGQGSSKPAGPGGSFSADLARELGAPEKADSAGTRTGGKDPAAAGSDGKAGDGKAGDAKASDAKAGEAKVGDAKAGEAKVGDAKVNDAKVGDAKAGDGKAGDAKAGDGKAGDAKAGGAKADSPGVAASDSGARPGSSSSNASAAAPEARSAPLPHGPVKVPADLAAIKLSLLPNWDRDVDEPGTFQYVVRIKGTQRTKTFAFRYGYDDPKAPADRDQYKKYLQDSRALTGEIRDRQRGAAWFLEGNDASGLPAFRYVVLYGGKRLICYGSLYRDAESGRLGDDRDQTLIQAKQICETLAL